MLSHQLKLKGRTLTRDQHTAAMMVLLKCPAPLYMDFLLIEMQQWKSFQESMPWRKTPPPSTIRDITKKYFQNLESEFGIVVISRLAAYISSSRHGLTEMELLDLMNTDVQVMCEVNKKWRRRLPPGGGGGATEASDDSTPALLTSMPSLFWSQIYHRLVHFLGHGVGAGGYRVLRWRHRHTAEFVASRYLTPAKKMKSTAGVLADYFLKKGFQQSSDEVSEFDDSTSDWTADVYLDAEKTQYNVRKLIELPYCLKRSGRTDELKELLFSYVWLKAKLTSLSCSEVIEDFSAVCPVVPVNRNEGDSSSLYELQLLRDALTLCAYSCNVDPDSFSQQLCGRLMPFVKDDFTRLSLKKLVTAALEDSRPPLLMPFRSLQRTPGGPLLTVMNGHRDVISGVSATLVKKPSGKAMLSIVTSSWDRTLKSWDLDSGGVLKTFDGHEDKVLSVSLTGDGQFVASGSADRTARFWCMSDAKCLHVLQGHTAEVNSVAVTTDGTRSVSASSDCSIKVWNTDNTSSSCGELIYTMDGHGRPILTLSLSHNTILASGDTGGIVLVTDIISGAILYRLKGSGAITALSTSEIDGVKCLLIGTGSGQSVVKELESGRSIQRFSSSTGEKGSAITAMAATPDGKVVISNKDKSIACQKAEEIW